MGQIYKTNNAILNISAFQIPSSNLGGSAIAISGISGDAIGREWHSEANDINRNALKTIILPELLSGGPEKALSGNNDLYVPTDSITISDEENWDYFDIYDQNAFTADRYIFSKSSVRSIEINGTFIIPSTKNGFDAITGQNIVPGSIVHGSYYMMSHFAHNDMQKYSSITKKYNLSIFDNGIVNKRINFGRYFLPQKWSMSIPAMDFRDVTWSASFIGPTISENDALQASDAHTPSEPVQPSIQYGNRTVNTRDFMCIPMNDTKNAQRYIIGLDLSIDITWENLPAAGSYFNSNNIPAPYYWSMKDQKGSLTVKEIFVFNKPYIASDTPIQDQISQNTISDGKISQNIASSKDIYNQINVYSFNLLLFTISSIYWQTCKINFQTDSIVVITRTGFFNSMSATTEELGTPPYVA